MNMVRHWAEQARNERSEMELTGTWTVMAMYSLATLLFLHAVWS